MPAKTTPAPTADSPADPRVAQLLQQGYVLVPYWGMNKEGHRIPCARWVRGKKNS